MFAKKYRLPLPVLKRTPPKNISTPYFLIKIFENKIGHNRFGIVIANRAVKKSTRRHFWKRRIVEFLKTWPNLKKDFLVIVSPRIEETPPDILGREFQKALREIAK